MPVSMKFIAVLFAVVLITAGCGLPGVGGSVSEDVATEIPPEPVNLTGTWVGTMQDGDILRDVVLVIAHTPPASEFTGDISLTIPSLAENYGINGTIHGSAVNFSEAGGRYFTATVADGVMTGYLAWGCYNCENMAMASFNVVLGGALPTVAAGAAGSNLNGHWTGGMYHIPTDATWEAVLDITQEPGSSEFYGSIQMTSPVDPAASEYYLISGTQTEEGFQFHDTGTEVITRYFWGFTEGASLVFWVSPTCYVCGDAYGEFTLTH